MSDSFNVIAFTKAWQFKGYVDPSLRDNVAYSHVKDTIDFIKNNKPENEHWLIEVREE